jgi:VanZ family protein
LKFNLKRAVSWILVFLWMGVIFSFSMQSGAESGGLSSKIVEMILGILNINVGYNTFEIFEYIVRKSAHATEYAILAILIFNALYNSDRRLKKVAVVSFLVSAIYSLTDEAHQLFVSGRGASLKDCGIDSTGALLGVILCLLVVYIAKRNKNCSKQIG